jgi:hypothetical protein
LHVPVQGVLIVENLFAVLAFKHRYFLYDIDL